MIGISSIDNINNFSEASRSRFTLISTSKYSKDEKTLLIKSLCPDYSIVNFYTFIEKFEKDKNEEISFTIISKILKIFQELNNNEVYRKERNLILAIYYSIFPFLNENEVNYLIKTLLDIFKEESANFILENENFIKFEFIFYEYEEEKNEIDKGLKPLLFRNNRTFSKATGLSILNNIENNDYEDDNNFENELLPIYFHQSFNNLLHAIHLSLVIHYPLIIEGETGI